MKDGAVNISLFSRESLPISIQSQFVDEWQRVEATLQTLESYQGVLLVPAYMGLRNSGRHFVDALSRLKDGDRSGTETALGRAVDELRRARHDALRSLVNYCHYKLLLIEERFGTERIFQVCPEYFEIREKIEEVNTRLNEDFIDSEEADKYFLDLEDKYIIKLLEVFERLARAKSAALDGIKEKDEREDWYKKLALAGFGVGLLGVILAVASLFL